jgi:hypothetical protein
LFTVKIAPDDELEKVIVGSLIIEKEELFVFLVEKNDLLDFLFVHQIL